MVEIPLSARSARHARSCDRNTRMRQAVLAHALATRSSRLSRQLRGERIRASLVLAPAATALLAAREIAGIPSAAHEPVSRAQRHFHGRSGERPYRASAPCPMSPLGPCGPARRRRARCLRWARAAPRFGAVPDDPAESVYTPRFGAVPDIPVGPVRPRASAPRPAFPLSPRTPRASAPRPTSPLGSCVS